MMFIQEHIKILYKNHYKLFIFFVNKMFHVEHYINIIIKHKIILNDNNLYSIIKFFMKIKLFHVEQKKDCYDNQKNKPL